MDHVEMMSAGFETNDVRILFDFKWVLDDVDINPNGANSAFDNVFDFVFDFVFYDILAGTLIWRWRSSDSWQAGAFASSPVLSGGHLPQLR